MRELLLFDAYRLFDQKWPDRMPWEPSVGFAKGEVGVLPFGEWQGVSSETLHIFYLCQGGEDEGEEVRDLMPLMT